MKVRHPPVAVHSGCGNPIVVEASCHRIVGNTGATPASPAAWWATSSCLTRSAPPAHGRDDSFEVAISHSAGPGRLSSVRRQPFEAIVTEYGPTVLRVCRVVLGPTAADDAWSETFLSAMRAYPDLRPDSNVEAWLVTIAHRKAIDQRRTEARRAIPIGGLPEPQSKDGVPGGWESDLWAALKALPRKQRETVAYHYIAGLPYADVARVVGGSPAAARRAAADGIATLRKTYLKGDAQ